MTELEKKVAALEERVETWPAQYEGALDRLRADMDGHHAESARRETRMLLAMVAAFGLAILILLLD